MFAVSKRPDHPASVPSLKAGCPPGALLFQIPHIHRWHPLAISRLHPSLSVPWPCAVAICFLGHRSITLFLSSSWCLSYTNCSGLSLPSLPSGCSHQVLQCLPPHRIQQLLVLIFSHPLAAFDTMDLFSLSPRIFPVPDFSPNAQAASSQSPLQD